MASLPACVVCDHPFKYRGPTPHLLPCLHSVCSLCVKSPGVQSVNCRVCERQFDLDGQDYPVSHVVLAEVLQLTSEKQPTEITCTNKDDGLQAVCWCQECSDYLCEHCQTSHSEVKITRRHTLHRLTEVAAVLKDIQMACTDHGLPKNLYDKDCDCFICSQCFVSQHGSHKTTSAGEIRLQEDISLSETLKSVSDKIEEVQDAITGVNEQDEKINEKFSTLKETVEHAFSELKTHIDQREKMLLVELDGLKECMKSTNNSRRPLLKALDTSCKTTVDFTKKSLKYTPAEHLVQMKKTLEDAKRYCLDGEVVKVHQHEASVSFLKQGMKEVEDTISTFGSFVTVLNPSGLPESSTPFQCAKTNMLKKKIEDYESKLEESSREMKALTKQANLNKNRLLTMQGTISQQENVFRKIVNDGILENSCLRIIDYGVGSMDVLNLQAMTMDPQRSHIHVNVRDGCFLELNKDPPNERRNFKGYKRLQTYTGTCARTPLPLPDNPSSPRAACYWEVEVELDGESVKNYKGGDYILLFEVAVCDEKVMDKNFCLGFKEKSCSLSVCAFFVDNCYVGMHVTHSAKSINYKKVIDINALGNCQMFNFGVLWETSSRKVTFLDCKQMEVLGSGTIPADSTRVWPMFNVHFGARSMKLVSGVDIKIGNAKKALICKALSG